MPQHLALAAAKHQVARIIVETVEWDAPEVAQGALVTAEQRRQPFVVISVDLGMVECRRKTVISGAGHWIQQERPREINDLLITFLNGL